MKKCPQCGKSYPPEFIFCRDDGTDLVAVAAPQPGAPESKLATAPPPAPASTMPAAHASAAMSGSAGSVSTSNRSVNRSVSSGVIVAGLVIVLGMGMFVAGNQSRQRAKAEEERRLAEAERRAAERAASANSDNSNETPKPIKVTAAPTPTRAPQAVTLPPPMARPSASDLQSVESHYNAWLSAWQHRDLNTYMSYYSRGLVQKRAGKPAYGYSEQRRRMADNWAKQSYISIISDKPIISIEGDQIVLEAEQTYDSSTWWDKGRKRLVWAKQGGYWVIVEESFAKRDGGSK